MKHEQSSLPAHFPAHGAGALQPQSYQQVALGYGTAYEDPNDESAFDPIKLFWFVVHYRWLIAAFLVTGLVAGIVYTYLQTPMYRASAKVEIQTAGAKVFKDLEVVSQSSDFRAFETAREKIRARDLARRVVFALNLSEKLDFIAPTPKFSLANLFKRIFGSVNDNTQMASLPAEQREAIAVGIVRGNLSVILIRNTSILQVGFSHPIPEYASLVANQIVRSFIDQNVDKRGETSNLARQFIQEQVAETKQKLQVSEKELVDYAQKAGITITGDDVSLISANIAEINSALSEAIQNRLAAERYNQQVEDGDAAALPAVFKSEAIQATKQTIAELKAKYQEKLGTLKPGFPEMKRLRAQIGELNRQIKLEIRSIAQSVRIRFEQSKEKEKALRRELRLLEQKQSEFQEKNIQYTILKREVDSNRTQYDSLIKKMSEIGIGAELKSSNASVVDLAVRPYSPYSPRLSRFLMASLALFGAMAAAAIYLLELMNNTFSVPDQLERDLKLPVLGILPFTAEADIQEAFTNSGSPLSEAYRTLRTSVQFTGADSTIKVLAITSSEPSEGKTTTAFKLAEDFALLGKKVLVIDADLRKPKLHRLFGTDNGIGLSNLLTNVIPAGNVPDLFRTTANPNVTFLSAGTVPPNPTDLLASQKMGLTLHFCSRKYDLVIVDSPPVMGIADTPIISRQVDATLLMVSANQVSRKSAKNALARLKSAGANVVGCALTKFAINNLDYNYAYRYMQYNYYSYSDSEAEQAKLENHVEKGSDSSEPFRPLVYFTSFYRRFFRDSR